MKIKHINAGPDEYVAVHRRGSRRGGGGSGGGGGGGTGNGMGCLLLLGIIFFWDEILAIITIVTVAAVGYGIIYCIGKFHREIWYVVVFFFVGPVKLLKKLFALKNSLPIKTKTSRRTSVKQFPYQ